jgi:hypothetical protein
MLDINFEINKKMALYLTISPLVEASCTGCSMKE